MYQNRRFSHAAPAADDFSRSSGPAMPHVPILDRGKAAPATENTEPIGKVGCKEWLGGLLKHSYRHAP